MACLVFSARPVRNASLSLMAPWTTPTEDWSDGCRYYVLPVTQRRLDTALVAVAYAQSANARGEYVSQRLDRMLGLEVAGGDDLDHFLSGDDVDLPYFGEFFAMFPQGDVVLAGSCWYRCIVAIPKTWAVAERIKAQLA